MFGGGGGEGGGNTLHMRVSVWPNRRAGSWKYLAGSWRQATFHYTVIFTNTGHNETIMSK